MKSKDIYDIIIEKIVKDCKIFTHTQEKHIQWEIPKYSKSAINKAGSIIADSTSSQEERENALTILNNWRAAHAYPLQVVCNNLRLRNPNAIVVQRLKRLDSITGKIERFPDMNLYRIQDLGGCRVIVNTIDEVYNSINKYKNSRIRHILKREYDYIQNPKHSGYRSYHMVYQFHSDKKENYNKNILIEIQFRTKLQHIWATAVEMMGIYTKNNLKSGHGDNDILRFFALVSSLFVIKENTPVCPDTSKHTDKLIDEVIKIDQKNNIIMKLKAINQAVQITDDNKNFLLKNGYYLLVLNYDEPSLNIFPFKQSDFETASNTYSKIETLFPENTTDTVLVSVKSFDLLKTAYPNYFIDISEFIDVLKTVIFTYGKHNEQIRQFLNANFISKNNIPVG